MKGIYEAAGAEGIACDVFLRERLACGENVDIASYRAFSGDIFVGVVVVLILRWS